MLEVGDFIGDYRIIASLPPTPMSTYVIVEHTRAALLPGLLAFYPDIVFSSQEEQSIFFQRSKEGSVMVGDLRLPLRDAGLQNQRPYLILPYNKEIEEELSKHDHLLAQTVQGSPANEHAPLLKNAFLAAILPGVATQPTGPLSPPLSEPTFAEQAANEVAAENSFVPPPPPLGMMNNSGKKPNKKRRPLLLALVSLILAALLVWGGVTLHTDIPASAATLHITPKALKFTNDYTVYVTDGNATNASQVPGRALTATLEHTETVPASGKGTHPATEASGMVVISQIQHYSSTSSHRLARSTINTDFGIVVTTDVEVEIPDGSTVQIPAHAGPAGSGSNIGPDSIDGPVDLVDNITNVKIGTGYVSNPDAFTGGQDARDYTFVQQSDLDGVSQKFSDQLTKDATGKVTAQVKTGEKVIHDPQCVPTITANHKANEEAADVTITISVTCKTVAYTEQAIHDTVTKEYQADGLAKYGTGYAIVGDMVSGPVTAGSADGSYNVNINGIWSYQYSVAVQQALKKSILGKTQEDALKVLQKRMDIQAITIDATGGIGSAIPENAQNIRLIIGAVTGLKAQ